MLVLPKHSSQTQHLDRSPAEARGTVRGSAVAPWTFSQIASCQAPCSRDAKVMANFHALRNLSFGLWMAQKNA